MTKTDFIGLIPKVLSTMIPQTNRLLLLFHIFHFSHTKIKKTIVYGWHENFCYINNATKILVNDTFSICPPGFSHVLIWMYYDGLNPIFTPAIYILMSSRTLRHYIHVFSTLRDIIGKNWEPRNVHLWFWKVTTLFHIQDMFLH